jgi:hypothetical protein
MWGPLVLAGDLGPRRESRGEGAPGQPVPLLVAAERPVSEWVLPGARQGDFQIKQVARPITQPEQVEDVSLTPFYRTHERTYSVYFDVVTPSEFDARVAALAAERERIRRLEAATVAYVRPGTSKRVIRVYKRSAIAKWRARMADRRAPARVVLVRSRGESRVPDGDVVALQRDRSRRCSATEITSTNSWASSNPTARDGFFDARLTCRRISCREIEDAVRFQRTGTDVSPGLA